VPGTEFAPDAAHGGDRGDLRRAGVLQCLDIGAVIHLVRRNAVRIAMAGKEDHFAPADFAERERTRGFAIRGARRDAARLGQRGQLRQAAAAEDR